jgi:hypothetical protein
LFAILIFFIAQIPFNMTISSLFKEYKLGIAVA